MTPLAPIPGQNHLISVANLQAPETLSVSLRGHFPQWINAFPASSSPALLVQKLVPPYTPVRLSLERCV